MHFLKNFNLISRLSVSSKFILIYALDISAVLFVSAILINEKFIAIDFARKEIVGNDYIAALREATFSIDSKDKAGAGAEAVLAAEDRFGKTLGNTGSRVLAQALAEQMRELQSTESVDMPALNAVIPAAKILMTHIGNQSNLILDPDLDSYYTMSLVVIRFPEVFDLLDKIQEKAIAAGSAPESEKNQRLTDYLILEGKLDAVSGGINSDYGEAMQASTADLSTTLEPIRQSLLKAINNLRDSSRQIAINHKLGTDLDKLSAFRTASRLELLKSWRQTEIELTQLLQKRIDGFFERMFWHFGSTLLLMLVILCLVFYIARQIAVPLRHLSKIAENVRISGDYTMQAEWKSFDEIGKLVADFNTMLAQLNQSRIIEQEMAVQASGAEAQRELLEAVPIALMVTSIPQHEVLHTNAPAQVWLQNQDNDPWSSGLGTEARVRFFQQLADTGSVDEFEALWQGDKIQSWVLLSARRLKYQNLDAVLTAFTPINRLKFMEQRLELWAKVFEASSESIMITNHERRILTANRAFCKATDYELTEVIGKQPDFFRSEHHSDEFYNEIWQAAAKRGSWQGEIWLQHKTGVSFPVWLLLNVIRNADGQIINYIASALDISERKANEERISYLAQHDVLTELPNRSLCSDRLGVALHNAHRLKCSVAVIFIDLDRFKNINDSLGHHIGDGLLRSVAYRLLESVRAGDTVSRLAGDEFIVILSNIINHEEINHIIENRLMPMIRMPHDVDGSILHISCSMGIAVYPADGEDIDTLMRNADTAMYQAKSLGRNKAEFFNTDMDRRAQERMAIEKDLRIALERDEMRVYFQPRIDCRTGKLIGAEALVRWLHPIIGLISPARFITIAEETGLILQLGSWVLLETCRQLAIWRDNGYSDIVISVNLSALQLRDPELLNSISQSLSAHAINPSLIELELTESLLMEHVTTTIELLHAIKALGLSLSVDDFGTGYSSLNYLHRFPIDKLKIDQSFVKNMLEDRNNLAITKAIIGLGHTLGLRVVAEGVEKVEEMRMLSAAGCDELQGYLFGKPMPADIFADWRCTYDKDKLL